MEFRHMVSFLALADELHFGRAATRLHLAQPSLSQHLQRLERDVGVELVTRNSHEVKLTAAGAVFRAEAREIVTLAEKAKHAARMAAAGRVGTITVGYNFPAWLRVLPPTMATMSARYPGVAVALREMRSGPQLAALDEGKLDLALVYGKPSAPHLRHRKLLSVSLVAVVGRHHRWADRGRIPFAELAGEPCILFDRAQSSAMYDAILSAADHSGIQLTVADQVDDPGATAIISSVKPVVGFCSAVRGEHAATGSQTATVQLYDPVPTLDLYAVWHEATAASALNAFVECLPDVAPKTDGVLI